MRMIRWFLGSLTLSSAVLGTLLASGRVTLADLRKPLDQGMNAWSPPAASTARDASPNEKNEKKDEICEVAPVVIAEGRLASYPGASVNVGAEITGTLIAVNVLENQVVRKGDVLAVMRSDDLAATRDLAKAELDEASAEVQFWERELGRINALGQRKAAPISEVDAGRRSLEVSKARQEHARAAIRQSDALIAKTRIVAPIDGTVVTRSAHPGETLTVAAPIVKLVDLARTRIEAEVDEYDVGKLAVGARCTITAEGFRGQSWSGVIEEIPADVVPRRIRPEDPARPADTRVVSVKVSLIEPTPLKIGQRVYVNIAASPEAVRDAAP